MKMPTAFILITSELGKEKDLLGKLRTLEHIIEAHYVYGVYDIIAKIEAEDMEKLREIVTFKIRCMDEVNNTLTMISIE